MIRLRRFSIRGGGFKALLIIVLIVAGVVSFYYLDVSGKLAQYKINLFSSIGTDELSGFKEDIAVSEYEEDLSIGVTDKEEQPEEQPEEEIVAEAEKEAEPAPAEAVTGESIEKTAQKGDSITTLARKAIKDYLAGTEGLDLTKEHKVFMEDYIQNRLGDRGLQIGEKLTISKSLIGEAASKAQQLSQSQLEELKNYSELVFNPPLE